MHRNETLSRTVASLIDRRSEGTYWDFKRCHHDIKGDLIHDVLCLANANHRGSRFLVFGVNNTDFSLHSIDSDPGRRTQADIAGLFRDNANKFFQSRFPEFHLAEVMIDGAVLDVLVIADTPYKPFFLVERYEKICQHHIYTRVCDTNTPPKDSAQPHEIERMWRERFGLDLAPLDRVKLYLNDPKAWVPNNRVGEDLHAHHKIFPEFTLRVTEAEEFMARNEEWTRGEVRKDNNHAGNYEIHYHQTCLARVRYVSFDDHKKSMVAPNWEARGAGRFYFYEAGSINCAMQKYLAESEGEDHSATLSIRGGGDTGNEARSRWGHCMEIPVLSPGELDEFLGPRRNGLNVEPSTSETEQYELFLRNQMEFEDWRKGDRS